MKKKKILRVVDVTIPPTTELNAGKKGRAGTASAQ
jgi:hypothetical protein